MHRRSPSPMAATPGSRGSPLPQIKQSTLNKLSPAKRDSLGLAGTMSSITWMGNRDGALAVKEGDEWLPFDNSATKFKSFAVYCDSKLRKVGLSTSDIDAMASAAQHSQMLLQSIADFRISGAGSVDREAVSTVMNLMDEGSKLFSPLRPLLTAAMSILPEAIYSDFVKGGAKEYNDLSLFCHERGNVATMIESLQSNVASKEMEALHMKTEMEDMSDEIARLKNKLSGMKDQLADQRRREAEQEELLSRALHRLSESKAEVQGLEEHLNRYRQAEKVQEHSQKNALASLQKQNDHLRESLRRSEDDMSKLMEENRQFKDLIKSMFPREHVELLERDLQKTNLLLIKVQNKWQQAMKQMGKTSRQSSGDHTPRPDWDLIVNQTCPGANVPPGTTAERAAFIATMLGGLLPDNVPKKTIRKASEQNKENFFEGLGTGPEVPKYLRFKGKVRNRNISKRDTEMMIKDIWKNKAKHDKKLSDKGKGPENMHEFLYVYFQAKHGNFQNVIVENAMNLLEGVKRYVDDADVEMFGLILDGELDEEVYTDQLSMLERLLVHFERTDAEENHGKLSGSLGTEVFERALRKFFSNKVDERLDELMESISEEHPNGVPLSDGKVVYKKLFDEDREFNQGPFAEGVRDQMVDEREEFVSDIEAAIQLLTGNNPDPSCATAAQIKKALLDVDPKKPLKDVNKYLQRGFQQTAQPKDNESIEIDTFLLFLKQGVLKRSSKPKSEAERKLEKAASIANMAASSMSKFKKNVDDVEESENDGSAGTEGENGGESQPEQKQEGQEGQEGQGSAASDKAAVGEEK